MQVTVIGIDCAAQPKNVGLALGYFSGERTVIEQVCRGSAKRPPVDVVEDWLEQRPNAPALLALDAPLGWPAPLPEALRNHRAGEALKASANELFHRTTDRFIRERIGIRPLEVGADKIARAAHAALALLGDLRERQKKPIPLAWRGEAQGVTAIEVYPAATLTAHEMPARRYKRSEARTVRECIVRELGERMGLPPASPALAEDIHILDAAVCMLAAQDFLRGEALPPPDQAPVEREGWIWVRARGTVTSRR